MYKKAFRQYIEKQREQYVKQITLNDKPDFLTAYYKNEIFSDLRLKMLNGVYFIHSRKFKRDNQIGYSLYHGGEHNSSRIEHYKYVYIDGENQADFEKVLAELNPNLRAITIGSCMKVKSLKPLERFHSLEFVSASYNNGVKELWNWTKTPKLKELHLSGFTKLKFETAAGFSELRHLFLAGAVSIPSCGFLRGLPKLEQLWLNTNILDNDIRPILELKNLKNYFVGDKRHRIIAKYLKDGTLPAPQQPSIYSDMPTSVWKECESSNFTKKQLKQIESILADYCKTVSAAETIAAAQEAASVCVKSLNVFESRIETSEREDLYEYIIGKVKTEWQDELSQTIENTRTW